MNVVMFHSVGNFDSNWYRQWLSVRLDHFEYFCRYLKKHNYKTYFLKEWYELQNTPDKQDKKQVVLTFDDGYLDNWVYAYPILKKYNLKGTIFINPEFVEPTKGLRPQYSENRNCKNLQSLGFLNWDEIIELDKSEFIDIQSHSMSHNHYFYDDELIDIYEGQEKYDWLPWLFKPERKSYYIHENQSSFVDFGYPVFKNGRALGLRRFIPSDKFIESFITKYNELKNTVERDSAFNRLKRFTFDYKEKHGSIGIYETDSEMEERYRYEIFESKRVLEKNLNKKIDFLCWPGGGYNDISLRISKVVGYKASTVSSKDKNLQSNNYKDYKRINRFGLTSYMSYNKYKKVSNNKKILVQQFLQKKGNLFYKNIMKIKKSLFLIECYIKN
ncbi:MAG: polysaccharide deacetylase family protein [Bacteroidales bacterium]|jgi:peptidoglycan/xylan/chitin deacetylase (PgdA/CDA1 family)|nr:polysaccharide deacetylase family protein [Bacteroidales bacterium]